MGEWFWHLEGNGDELVETKQSARSKGIMYCIHYTMPILPSK
jgi:hypothetical protein